MRITINTYHTLAESKRRVARGYPVPCPGYLYIIFVTWTLSLRSFTQYSIFYS